METTTPARVDEAEHIPSAYRPRWKRVSQSPWFVAALVLLVYGAMLVAFFRTGNDARYFIVIGRNFVVQSSASTSIRIDPHFRYGPNPVGYDGQFCYYIALDPVHARYYIDLPAYRYQRILYPILARLLALGQAGLIPYTLLLINWLALAGGTLAIAAWLKRKGCSPYFALLFGFYDGLFVSFTRDLTEPLSYALVALAIYLFTFGGRRRVLWAGVVFGLSALARETGAIFAVVYGLGLMLEGGFPSTIRAWRERIASRWRPVTLLLVTALVPLVLYKAFLAVWLRAPGVNPVLIPQVVPLAGLFGYRPWYSDQYYQLLIVVVPGIICAIAALRAITLRIWPIEVWALLVNIELLIFMLPPADYVDIYASPRLSTGVVLAALYCLPAFDKAFGKNRMWLAAVGTFWVSFTPYLAAFIPGVHL